MVFLFDRTIKVILPNCISHETIICDDQDLSLINNRVKELVNEKNSIFQSYLHSNKDPKLSNKVEYLQSELKSLIEGNKKSITHVSQKKKDKSFIDIDILLSVKITLNFSITSLLTNAL